MRVRPRDRQRHIGTIRDTDVEDVLGELVQRIASRRGPAQAQFQRAGGDIQKADRHVHQPVLGLAEGQPVLDGRLRPRERLDAEEKQEDKQRTGAACRGEHAWLRHPDETARAYAAFRYYRNLGAARSQKSASSLMTGHGNR